MVHCCCLGQFSVLPALHAERMFDQIVPSHSLPFPGMIELSCTMVTKSGIILRISQFFVFRTVPFVCQLGASRIGAWVLRFVRHGSLQGKRKPTGRIILWASHHNCTTCQEVDSSGTRVDFGRLYCSFFEYPNYLIDLALSGNPQLICFFTEPEKAAVIIHMDKQNNQSLVTGNRSLLLIPLELSC